MHEIISRLVFVVIMSTVLSRVKWNMKMQIYVNHRTSVLKQGRQCTCNVILRRVHGTTLAVEKQKLLYISVYEHVRAGVRVREGVVVCLRACSLTYPACKTHAPYCHLRPLWIQHIFRHYLINGTIFGKRSPCIKRVLIFSTTFIWNIILRIIQRDVFINVKYSAHKVPVSLVGF
jgi:hypothetical protein